MTLDEMLNHLRPTPEFIAALPVAALVIVGAIILRLVLSRGLTLAVRRTRLEETHVRPLRPIISGAITLGAILVVLGVFGFNIGGLWTVFSTILAMVAIGFVAVWSVLSNLTGTVIILVTRPFAIGDLVEFPGEQVKGKVIDLTFVHTTLRAEDGALLRIPNTLFFQKSLKVFPSGGGTVSLAQQLHRDQPAD